MESPSKKRRWKNGNSSSPNGRFPMCIDCASICIHIFFGKGFTYICFAGDYVNRFFFWSYVPFSGKCDSYSVKTPWAAGLDLEMLPDFTIFPQKWRGKSQESPNNYSGLIWFDSGPLFRFFCIGTSYESHPFIFDTPLLRSQSATDISMPKSCRRWSFPRRHGGRPQKPQIIPVKDHDLVLKQRGCESHRLVVYIYISHIPLMSDIPYSINVRL